MDPKSAARITHIESLLASAGYRRTRARAVVIHQVVKSEHSISHQQLITNAVHHGIDRSSAYRAIDVLLKESIIKAITTHGKIQYELSLPHSDHHHHLACNTCGQIISVHSPKLESVIKFLADKHNFSASSHTFEITGICENCQLKGAPHTIINKK